MPPLPRITIFAPDPLLSIAIEAREGSDEVHVHPAGQGVWVARMAGELGALPILCGLIGGETGATLSGLLDRLPGERRLIDMGAPSGTYVVDRRGAGPELLARALRPAPRRHELDDLLAVSCAAALGSALLVVCNPFPPSGVPDTLYGALVADVAAAGVPVIVDLSTPRLEHALPHEPDIVKLNDWELAEYVCGPVDGPRALDAARRLQDAGAQSVVLTRAAAPILVLPAGGDPFEVIPPAFPSGHREGCGDTMTGALATALAQGQSLRDAVVLGAAAGSGNFLRHGLGTGRREDVLELASHVGVRALRQAAPR